VERARARLEEEAAQLDDPELARSFLEQPDSARLLALAQSWGLGERHAR
jgi:hypothetical protein